jgi:hypothetical protein
VRVLRGRPSAGGAGRGAKLLVAGGPVVLGPRGLDILAQLLRAGELARQPLHLQPLGKHAVGTEKVQQAIGREGHAVFEQRRSSQAVEQRSVGADEDELDRAMRETGSRLEQGFGFHDGPPWVREQ